MTTLLLTTVVVVSFAGLWTGVVAVSDFLVSVVAKWLKNYTAEPTQLCNFEFLVVAHGAICH